MCHLISFRRFSSESEFAWLSLIVVFVLVLPAQPNTVLLAGRSRMYATALSSSAFKPVFVPRAWCIAPHTKNRISAEPDRESTFQ